MAFILNLTKNAPKQAAESNFKRLQLFSAAAYSFSHGTNDAQKTMGIIVPLLFSIGYFGTSVDPNYLPVPLWVILAAHTAIALGTLSGGWCIVKTMGYKITKLRPVHGFAAETAGASTIIGASLLGIPVSTTHIICTSIMGVGTTMGISTVKWGVARRHPVGMDPYPPGQCLHRIRCIHRDPAHNRILIISGIFLRCTPQNGRGILTGICSYGLCSFVLSRVIFS